MSEELTDPTLEEPAIEDVLRYYDGAMPAWEARQFEERAARSDAFAEKARAIWRILEQVQDASRRLSPERVEEILQQQRGRRWRKRLEEAAAELAQRGRRLALLAEEGAEAALEIAFGAAARTAEILAAPAAACVRPQARLQFGYAGGAAHKALRTRGAAGRKGFFVSAALPQGARVSADPSNREIVVEFPGAAPERVFLLSEHPRGGVREAGMEKTADGARAVFRDVQPGRHLLAVPRPN